MPENPPLPPASHLPKAEPPSESHAQISGLGGIQAVPPLTLPPVARGTPAEERALYDRCYTRNLILLSDTTEQYLGQVQKLAAVRHFLDVHKSRCDAVEAECEALQRSCEEAEMKAKMDVIEKLEATEAELMARIARVKMVQEKGWCPIVSPTGTEFIIVDTRYQLLIDKLRSDAVPFKGKRLSATNKSLVSLRDIPHHLRKPKHGTHAHGPRIAWEWFIAREDAGHGLLVYGKDKTQEVHNIIQSKEVELFTSCDRGLGIVYFGTFLTGNVSYAFKDVVTGYIPELVDQKDFGHDDDPLTELLVQWRDRENDLRFIVLTYKDFRTYYYDSVDAFLSSSTTDERPRAKLPKK